MAKFKISFDVPLVFRLFFKNHYCDDFSTYLGGHF